MTVEEHAERVRAFFARRPASEPEPAYTALRLLPDGGGLLRYLETHGFTSYASPPAVDFMRPVTGALYLKIRRSGSSAVRSAWTSPDGTSHHLATGVPQRRPGEAGPIWERVGRRPIRWRELQRRHRDARLRMRR